VTTTAPARRGRPPKRGNAFRYGNPENKPAKPTPLPGYRPKPRLPPGTASHLEARSLPVTLPASVYREITDEDLGMPRNDAAQVKAETYIRAVIGHGLREEAKAREAARLASAEKLFPGKTVAVEVPDASVTLIDATDQLDQIDREILAEFRRLKAMLPARWRVAAA